VHYNNNNDDDDDDDLYTAVSTGYPTVLYNIQVMRIKELSMKMNCLDV